ncbi:MAG: secondary thiamine-phosphate synthase enzyme YjbQ [Ignavibacteria bacterium]|nr:secondary thiamine-phosphate synthase enzyme YjbQ [Ignavibacteria bacterium]MBT8383453.1 secondary thiamine-phosphate synthase enzyme YjbQ [Ignavibacteria bacterium]MBT8390728.1 secondary thiamine-phosphate synthase enzyme YjbQ [Ignavibacteria bacterium]NNJ52673.1 YjbQ family protein [Ignavibacteriaceae bacterium]NNL22531.1 YjbQ family protein [Ignavibacteriaceae bacterium]
MWLQKEILLKSKHKGFHLITDEIVSQLPMIKKIKIGLLNIFIKHTSASLTLNENYDPDVRSDMEKYFNQTVRENEPYYDHTSEGADDIPAHIKSTLIGASLSIPITNGNLNLGTWQGIYLCEHRYHAGSRKIVTTILGEEST